MAEADIIASLATNVYCAAAADDVYWEIDDDVTGTSKELSESDNSMIDNKTVDSRVSNTVGCIYLAVVGNNVIIALTEIADAI